MKGCLLLVLTSLIFTGTRSQGFSVAEYYYDTDPGIGSANAINLGFNTAATINFSAVISTIGLSNGIHTLNIRVKNVSGWSQIESRLVYVSRQTENVSPVASAEYFFDNDPGLGNGQTLSSFTEGNTILLTANINTNNLTPGSHSLMIRVKNSAGQWSLYEQRLLYVSNQTNKMPALAAAEYYIDLDPGPGKATTLIINNSGDTVNQTFICNVPSGTTNGQHFLWIRIKDGNGLWSLVARDTLSVNSVLPLQSLSFGGNAFVNNIKLKWNTENEKDVSRYEIERSSNGVIFEKIGIINALNPALGIADYTFNDVNPFYGINFYRLKQVDADGKSSYTSIIKIYFNKDAVVELKIFPNPVEKNLKIVFNGKEKFVTVSIFDVNGKFVNDYLKENNGYIDLNVELLPKGSYYVRLSDGISIQTGKFIKH